MNTAIRIYQRTASDDAKALLYWAENARSSVADNESDAAFCLECARKWAMMIIGAGV